MIRKITSNAVALSLFTTQLIATFVATEFIEVVVLYFIPGAIFGFGVVEASFWWEAISFCVWLGTFAPLSVVVWVVLKRPFWQIWKRI